MIKDVSFMFSGKERQKQALRKTAVPSIFSWTCEDTLKKNKARQERYRSREVQKKRKLFEDITNSEENVSEPEFIAQKVDMIPIDDFTDLGGVEEIVQYDNRDSSFEAEEEKQSVVQISDVETQTLKLPPFCIHNFEHDSAAVHFYTGLEDYLNFFFVLNTLGPAAYCLNYIYHSVVSISVPNQFFIVLMKLRRHTTSFELSRMFGVSESVITNIFITWVIFMEKQWREINIWPSQDLVQYFAPSSFKRNFPNTRVIIDGTECPIKKPKNPTSQQATFSTYKNRNTVKVLVGITPGGLISYVSSSYGGSTSDRQIVERSALTQMCSKNDSIMADKGFNVQDIFAPHDVHINIPTFFKKKIACLVALF